MANSKIIYYGEVLMDLTGDDVKPENLLKGIKAHDSNGDPITGSCEYDVNSSGASATAAEILKDKTAAVKGSMVEGTMPNNGAVEGIISDKNEAYTIPSGFHDGSGKVMIDQTERDKLVGENIRQGVNILGVDGTMSGTEGIKAQSVTVTPSKTSQTVLPDTAGGYNYISQVVVNAVPYVTIDNGSGKGTTVQIG